MKLFSLLLVLFAFKSFGAETRLADVEWIHLLHDQPMYFIIGPPETKAQLSMKAKLFPQTDLYAAYTQRMFWDLFQPSSPFRDINYNPSLFYRFTVPGDTDAVFDVIGFEHESNGKGGLDSRSWNRVGVRYQVAQNYSNGFKGELIARLWYPFSYDPGNPDLAYYRGIYEVTFTLSNFLGNYFDLNDLSLRFYPGGKYFINPFQGGRELTLRLKGHSVGFLANLVFQVFQGYAENMLEYDHSVWGARMGIGI